MSVPTKSPPATPLSSEVNADCWQIEETNTVVIIRDFGFPASDPQPTDWQPRLEAYFNVIPNLAAVGIKRLTPEGKIFSMGEFLIHPKGFHHLGQDQPAICYRFPEEVDVISGGLLAINRDYYHQVGGLDETLGTLALIDLGLKLRRDGGRCLAVPEVVLARPSELFPDPTAAQAQAFHERWGFDWCAPDLDDVSARHGGTGLLWNVRFWGRALPFEKYLERPAVHWNNYVNVEPYRQRADHLTQIVATLTPTGLAVDLGCGDGLFTHLLALRGVEALGIDPEEVAVNQALERTADHQAYPGLPPRFVLGNGAGLPLENDTAQTVFMFDVIEHLPNPIRVLAEAARVIKPGGHLFVTTPAAQFGASSDPVYHLTEYSPVELERQLSAVAGLTVTTRGNIAGIYRDILIAARKH